MCVWVIPPRETGGPAYGNWSPAALARVAVTADFAPGINQPHVKYKSSAASHLTSAPSLVPFPNFHFTSFPNFRQSRPPRPPRPPCPLYTYPRPSSAASHIGLYFLALFPNFRQPARLDLLAPFYHLLYPALVSASLESNTNAYTTPLTYLADI